MRLPSPSMAVSLLALAVATGGTSYAAAQIGSAGIRDNSVRSVDVRDGGLRPVDFSDAAKQALRGAPGQDGAEGPEGPIGPRGEDGSPARWVLVNAAGQIEAQSGGFEIKAAYNTVNNTTDGMGQPGTVPAGAFGNVYIDANEDLSNNAIVAVIALQNQVNQDPADADVTSLTGQDPMITSADTQAGNELGADQNPEFSGEIAATRCGIPMVVACAPTGTNTAEHFVVSPRMSDGQPTTADTRKRFYIVIAGDSSDYVPAP